MELSALRGITAYIVVVLLHQTRGEYAFPYQMAGAQFQL